MSGILIYSEKEAKRNIFAINKFKENLDIKLADENYDGKADFVINRTNYEFMYKNGIEILPINYSEIPAVKKPIDGHGGQNVTMINKKEEFEPGFVYQKPCATLGKDLRVWAIGGKIITAILRESDTDFRSNFCLGGKATPYELNHDETALVKKVLSLIKSDYIGIDFLFDNGHLIFNEIEDTVGARMVYDKTDIDIIKLYCNYIKKEVGTK